jgi:hypothetical protein
MQKPFVLRSALEGFHVTNYGFWVQSERVAQIPKQWGNQLAQTHDASHVKQIGVMGFSRLGNSTVQGLHEIVLKNA